MSRVNYSTVNDMVDVELAMSRIISQCEMTLDYIGNTSDDCTDKMDNIMWSLMTLHDFAMVVEEQAIKLQLKD